MGKHSAPSQLRPRLVRAGTIALAASTLPILNTGIAEATESANTDVLEIIAKCESGNKNVNTVGGSTASGYLQILDSTWKAFGGTQYATRAIHANREEQFIVGARVLAGQGIAAWNPSKSCWGSKVGQAPRATIAPVEKKQVETPKKVEPAPKKTTSAPKVIKKQPTAPPTRVTAKKVAGTYLIKRGDTLNKIAKKNGTTWRHLFEVNHDTVRNPNRIYAGRHLRLG